MCYLTSQRPIKILLSNPNKGQLLGCKEPLVVEVNVL